MKRFRGGLVFKAHRRVYHSTQGWKVIKKKRQTDLGHFVVEFFAALHRFDHQPLFFHLRVCDSIENTVLCQHECVSCYISPHIALPFSVVSITALLLHVEEDATRQVIEQILENDKYGLGVWKLIGKFQSSTKSSCKVQSLGI